MATRIDPQTNLAQKSEAAPLRIRTLLLFLIGNRQAILDIAANRHAFWIGALFVLSAAFARDYDGEDLLHEPWHLLIPFAASIVASLLLFIVVDFWGIIEKEKRRNSFSAYCSFLALFWMTAPLAWLYAIPYERFLSAGAATSANLWTLALVALWRVLLMIRVVSVTTNRHPVGASFIVAAFGDAVALAASFMMPMPVISFMGGVRLSESEDMIVGVTIALRVFAVLAAPILGLGALLAIGYGRWSWCVPTLSSASKPAAPSLWALAVASVTVWVLFLPWTQREQLNRTRATRELQAGRIEEALEFMSAHERSDFPPLWDPPPRVGYGETTPHILDVMEAIFAHPPADWVRAIYVGKLRDLLGEEGAFFYWDEASSAKSGAQLARIVKILQQIPEGPDIASTHRRDLEYRLREDLNDSPRDRDMFKALLELARKKQG